MCKQKVMKVHDKRWTWTWIG